ncbi:MAG: serine/threonine-protein kinase, partial [Planctomycetota bacterium]
MDDTTPEDGAPAPAAQVPAGPGPTGERAGDVIDRYTLVEPLGEGGMGTVWRATQSVPVKREVALKIVKLGMDTREVVQRFEAERQALALMDHPGIAKVLDGGATSSGRPYFVMELVAGAPITKFCDEQRLALRERLELFAEVCDAVQHAHHKGVIHRDLKPSNVLVAQGEHGPAPKVIDFGIAKATSAQLTEATMQTELGQIVG